jgi:hypothetical protein
MQVTLTGNLIGTPSIVGDRVILLVKTTAPNTYHSVSGRGAEMLAVARRLKDNEAIRIEGTRKPKTSIAFADVETVVADKVQTIFPPRAEANLGTFRGCRTAARSLRLVAARLQMPPGLSKDF